MSQPTHYEWENVQAKIQKLATTLDETALAAKSADRKTLGANLASLLRQQAKEFGVALEQHNAIVATEKASIEQMIQRAMDEQQQAMAAAEKAYAAQSPVPAPPAAPGIPETDPAPRLRQELLDRYGKRESKPGERPKGFDTWLGSSMAPADSMADAPTAQPAAPATSSQPADDLEQAWMPFFGAGSSPPPAPPPPPLPPAPKKPAGPEKSSRGWATWMDESTGGGSVNT